MSKIAVIARFKAKPEASEQIEAALRSLVDVVAAEEGTEQYVVHRDQSDPDTFWLHELYTDMGALGAHSSSPQLGELMVLLGDALTEPPLLAVMAPLAAKGVDV